MENFRPSLPMTGRLVHLHDLALTCPVCHKSFSNLHAIAIPGKFDPTHPDSRVFAIRLLDKTTVCQCLLNNLEYRPFVRLFTASCLNN